MLLYVGTYIKELHKMVYLQNRRYLPECEKQLRCDKTSFPDKAQEVRAAPPKRDYTISSETRRCFDSLKDRLAKLYVYYVH